MVIFLIDSQIAVLSRGFYQNGKKKKKKEPMEAAELFLQHCSKGFSGQGTFRRLEEKNQDTFYQVPFLTPGIQGKSPGDEELCCDKLVLYYSANVLHPVKFGCGQWTTD